MAPERLTREQAAIIGAYTGICCGPFADIQALGDKLLERPTWTHEYGQEWMRETLREKSLPLFLAICAEQGKE